MLGHLQRADVCGPRAPDLVRLDRCFACALPSGATQSDLSVRPEASVQQIWVSNALVRTGELSARVLPCGSRPHTAATQRAGAMLVKGWLRRLPEFRSMLRHLAACCAARRLSRPLQCWCFGLCADIKCLQVLLSWPPG
jgi:hypothetical protein